jgi:hypothetical protein
MAHSTESVGLLALIVAPADGETCLPAATPTTYGENHRRTLGRLGALVGLASSTLARLAAAMAWSASERS